MKITNSVNDTVKMEVCNTLRIYHQSTEVIDEGFASGLTLSLDIFEAVNCSCEIVSCTTLLIAAFLKIPKLMKIFLIWSVLINFTTLIQLVLLIVDSISYLDKVILYIELWIIGCFFNLRFFISVFKYKKTMEQSNDTEDLLPKDCDDEADFVVIDLKQQPYYEWTLIAPKQNWQWELFTCQEHSHILLCTCINRSFCWWEKVLMHFYSGANIPTYVLFTMWINKISRKK